MLALKIKTTKENQVEGTDENEAKFSEDNLEKLFFKLYLSGLDDWDQGLQKWAKDLISEFGHLFALNDLNFGKISVVKHISKLTNQIPFKERYRRIPPSQFEEVRKCPKEMLEVGTIRSNSPWASAMVLVRKKDESLWFYIDLRKVNGGTMKDANSLPRIDETVDCLNWATLFTAFDLKLEY